VSKRRVFVSHEILKADIAVKNRLKMKLDGGWLTQASRVQRHYGDRWTKRVRRNTAKRATLRVWLVHWC